MSYLNKKINIITYHYVRNLDSKFLPNLKVLNIPKFKKQINYLKKNFEILSFDEIKFYLKHNLNFPKNSCWLTFDDGYIDHYKNVLPILKKNNLKASFFPLVTKKKIEKILDVNKIQMILANCKNFDYIIKDIKETLETEKTSNLLSFSHYRKKYFMKNSFDSANVAFIKRLLQFALPNKLRVKLVNYLFKKYVKKKEKNIAKNFYMNEKQIKYLIKSGMHIGGHGLNHLKLNELNVNEQIKEIKYVIDFLKYLGVSTDDWVMCYPYGQYNKTTVKLLKKYNCLIGLTVKRRIADFEKDSFLEIPRFDTNDIFVRL